MSAYVDLSSSEESENKVTVAKRRRNDDSESGSDVSPPTGHHLLQPYSLANTHILLSNCSTIRQPIQTQMRDAVAVAMLVQELAVSYPPVATEVGHLERVAEEIQTLRMKRNQRFPMQIVM